MTVLGGGAFSYERGTPVGAECEDGVLGRARLGRADGFHVETLIIYKLGFNQNYYTFALILLIKIVLCSKFH